ncbi:MAG: chorismate synthase, partial [Paludibacteraceae bacterium]|nr:chorismate synthase [Paludibacteraceae bacterium]
FGNIFRLTCFGESHGRALGGVIDGCPAGVVVDEEFVQSELDRRRPGQSSLTTSRNEADKVEFLSGIFEGKTTGTPIGFVIYNTNQHSSDYANIKDVFRPSHADYTYTEKYGFRDYRGGGRSSARETACRMVSGALAKLMLKQAGFDIQIVAKMTEVGGETENIEQVILKAKEKGDTVGGIISCNISGVPVGWGEPVFGKLQSMLASAMLSINAAKGFEYGMGFEMAKKFGSEVNDIFTSKDGKITTLTNNSGGIQGGISNGEDIYFRVAFKPVATLLTEQPTVDKDGNATMLKVRGRHDACVLPRAVPIVEAMAAMVLADAYLLNKSSRL